MSVDAEVLVGYPDDDEPSPQEFYNTAQPTGGAPNPMEYKGPDITSGTDDDDDDEEPTPLHGHADQSKQAGWRGSRTGRAANSAPDSHAARFAPQSRGLGRTSLRRLLGF